MQKIYFIRKTSQDLAAAMLIKPQNRKLFVEPFLTSLKIVLSAFLFTSGKDSNFLLIVSAQTDEQVETLCNIVFAQGNFFKLKLVQSV